MYYLGSPDSTVTPIFALLGLGLASGIISRTELSINFSINSGGLIITCSEDGHIHFLSYANTVQTLGLMVIDPTTG